MVRRAWQQACEVAGHTTSSARRQREMDAGVQFCSSSLIESRTPARRIVSTILRVDFRKSSPSRAAVLNLWVATPRVPYQIFTL